ncbi:succinate dehydrogenase, hydrophobic membrane anchor protein [Sulfobacillus harzensis]|uniref:Succinate dehydrogenase hydrophobic membrane anchor subunit n=1 Tax=Sulfobacillus harzensis TaxID=2729629 RepID=A0A7Y0L3Y8_9FIRM|nr:succinate dehydrogenase, hydrophobic membrane anchor protein [Sulfobacillus harzensis]NMP22492.1 succinate dehydrogenase, hydrophobic membrane anchor protein [Sulfobacillus harzensis]
MMSPNRPGGAWQWFLQRVSAVLLLVLVLGHLWIEHFLHLGSRFSYQGVAARLVHGFYDAIDYALLVVVVYHGLNGLYHVLTDRMHRGSARRTLAIGLSLVGIATVVLGADILSAFLTPHPWFLL